MKGTYPYSWMLSSFFLRALLALAGGQLQESGLSASQAHGILLSSPCHLPALWAERPAVLWAVEIRNTGGGTGLRVLCGN